MRLYQTDDLIQQKATSLGRRCSEGISVLSSSREGEDQLQGLLHQQQLTTMAGGERAQSSLTHNPNLLFQHGFLLLATA